MTHTRIADEIIDSSLWLDGSYEGCATAKLFIAILIEARTQQGRIRRLTAVKASRIGGLPLEVAQAALDRLTGPDPDDSSGIAEGRRLLPDPDGRPNDYIVTNWDAYGRRLDREAKTIRQRRWRAKKAAEGNSVDENVYTPSTDRLHVDQLENKRIRESNTRAFARGVCPDFEELWSRYPRKKGKKEALRHFRASVHDDRDLADIRKALEIARRRFAKVEPRFIPYGKSWFFNWRDELEADSDLRNESLPASGRKLEVVL